MTYAMQSCIDACNECAVACDRCAALCLSEDDVGRLARCIALDVDCGAVCRVAASLMARGSEFAGLTCELCAEVCEECARECERHADMDHCQECAEACRTCATACRAMARQPGVGATPVGYGSHAPL